MSWVMLVSMFFCSQCRKIEFVQRFVHQYPQADSWTNPGIPPEHCHLHSNPSCIWIDLCFGGDCQGR
jgi:hypothetical protein